MKKRKTKLFVLLFAVISLLLIPSVMAQAASTKLKKSSVTMAVGGTTTLKATVKGKSSTVTWSSSNKAVATVSKSGKVKALRRGRSVIRAKANGKTAKCTVTVFDDVLRLSDFNITSSMTGITLGSPYVDVHSYLSNGSSTAYYAFNNKDAEQYQLSVSKVVRTLRGITLGNTRSEVLLAYGNGGTLSSFSTSSDKIYLIEATSKASEYYNGTKTLKNASSVLVYTYPHDTAYAIRFYFDKKNKLISVVYTKNYNSIWNYSGWSSY